MTQRVYNFSAGPAVLPEPVLRKAQEEMLALPGVGASVLEISHRSGAFGKIMESAKARLTELLGIPDNYRILFLQGGSRLQFCMLPMNLLRGSSAPAGYLVTGSWGKYALADAQREGATHVLWDGKETNYDRLPPDSELDIPDKTAYVHFTSNETIQGVEYRREPDVKGADLICDASSDFLSRPLPIDQYAMIYACAQKNAGPAGVTVVIIREDLLERSSDDLPGMLSYKVMAEKDSLYNTPPTFGIYMVDLIAGWLLDEIGGLDKMFARNQDKAKLVYDILDANPDFYRGHAQPEFRSLMNATFRLPNEELEAKFLADAANHGLTSLKGHRSVGGIRASIYNAMPVAGVQSLASFMKDFCEQHAG